MKLTKKQVHVELRTLIDDQGQKELSILKQTGVYIGRNKREMISYTEQTEDFGEIKNIITIFPNKVTIRRVGLIQMNQQFIIGKRSECLYRHPYGSFIMEIDTKSIEHRALTTTDEGSVHIEYDAKMNDDAKRRHHVTFTYMEEK